MNRVAKFNPKVVVRGQPNSKIWSSSSHYFGRPHFVTLLCTVCGTSSHTAVFIGKRKIKICWDDNFWVNSFKKNLVARLTIKPQFMVVLTYFLVTEDARTLEFCYPDETICLIYDLSTFIQYNIQVQ